MLACPLEGLRRTTLDLPLRDPGGREGFRLRIGRTERSEIDCPQGSPEGGGGGRHQKEQFRMFMRMYENFSGCRVLAYCIMCNHVHILLEVPPMPAGGLSDAELRRRLRAIYGEKEVKVVEKQLAEARQAIAEGRADESLAAEIHARFTYRMHDLGHYMKTLLGRYTQWFNHTHQRTGTLWEGPRPWKTRVRDQAVSRPESTQPQSGQIRPETRSGGGFSH